LGGCAGAGGGGDAGAVESATGGDDPDEPELDGAALAFESELDESVLGRVAGELVFGRAMADSALRRVAGESVPGLAMGELVVGHAAAAAGGCIESNGSLESQPYKYPSVNRMAQLALRLLVFNTPKAASSFRTTNRFISSLLTAVAT